MKMPDLQEVAFLRSPVAHGEMTSVSIAEDIKDQVVLREQMDCSDIIADSKLPTYQASTMPPLAKSKVRYVGEPVAMAFAPTRAEAEDLTEEIHVEYKELPAYANIDASLVASEDLLHEGWKDNVFLTLSADADFEEHAAKADRIVEHQVSLARQCM